MRGSLLPAPIVDGMDYQGVKSWSRPILSRLSVQLPWGAAVASGGARALAGFHPSGAQAAPLRWLPAQGRRIRARSAL